MSRLVTFEAASRTANFSRAAEDLGITRISVSRQMAELEALLGVTLFHRNHRSVSLTEAGKHLKSEVIPALLTIADTLTEIQEQGASRRVSITTTTAFATYWLMPRLADFGARFPEIELNLVVSDRYLDLDTEGIDVAVRYTDQRPEGRHVEELFREEIFPVFSPAYPARGRLQEPRDLLDEVLIGLAGPYRPEARWPHWFQLMGVAHSDPVGSVTMNTYITMLQAAIEGQGVALAGSPLVDSYLRDRTLVTLPQMFSVERETYFLVEAVNATPDASRLYNWIIAQSR